ncbi:MAG: SAM-dependent methyltransferase [Mycobacterium sp.]
MSTPDAKEHWEQHYGERDRVWSGRANAVFAEIVAPLKPGAVLDLGCGEGGDAMWLAEHGWQVVAVDISETALQRGAEDANARGVGDRIEFRQHDLAESFPEGTFDLVSAQFLHSKLPLDRTRILKRAADAIRPGGLLLIVDHGGAPPWASKLHHDHEFPSADEVVAALDLPDAEWERVRVGPVEREATGPNGETGALVDNVIVLRRRTSG